MVGLKGVEIPAIPVTKFQGLEKELEIMKRENESVMDRLNEYNISLRNSGAGLKEEQLKISALARKFKKIERECYVLPAELDLQHKSTSGSSVMLLLNVIAG